MVASAPGLQLNVYTRSGRTPTADALKLLASWLLSGAPAHGGRLGACELTAAWTGRPAGATPVDRVCSDLARRGAGRSP
jgi:hypothetical protein